MHHLPPFAKETAELRANPSFKQQPDSSSSRREYRSRIRHSGRTIPVYLKPEKKAYVAAFGCSHPKPSCLVSIQMAHLTKHNCQPQIGNNLLWQPQSPLQLGDGQQVMAAPFTQVPTEKLTFISSNMFTTSMKVYIHPGNSKESDWKDEASAAPPGWGCFRARLSLTSSNGKAKADS